MTMFCIASTLAMYSCLEPLVMASYSVSMLPVLRLPRINLYLCIIQLELRQFLLLAASIATSATWFVFRKTDWSWILQDILGIMFSINMLKVLRLPSLKICTILLSALFFYDIFFVFITPLFMEGGKSVMVEVATGGDSGEQLPMVLRVPHLSTNPSRVCFVHTYSLLVSDTHSAIYFFTYHLVISGLWGHSGAGSAIVICPQLRSAGWDQV